MPTIVKEVVKLFNFIRREFKKVYFRKTKLFSGGRFTNLLMRCFSCRGSSSRRSKAINHDEDDYLIGVLESARKYAKHNRIKIGDSFIYVLRNRPHYIESALLVSRLIDLKSYSYGLKLEYTTDEAFCFKRIK